MGDREYWKEFYEQEYEKNRKKAHKNETNYGAAALILLIVSVLAVFASGYIFKDSFGSNCLTWLSILSPDEETLKISFIVLLIAWIFNLLSIAYAGAGLATNRGNIGAILTLMLTIMPIIIFTICFAFDIPLFGLFVEPSNNPNEPLTSQCL